MLETTKSQGAAIQAGMLGMADVSVEGTEDDVLGADVSGGDTLSRAAVVLLDMFAEIQKSIADEWMCFRALVHILGDAARLHPLEPELQPVAEGVIPLLKAFVSALEGEDRPFDPLGEVFTHVSVADDDRSGGQVLTPRWICEYINDQTVGHLLDEIAAGETAMDHPLATLDPAAGTGRFPIDLCQRYGNLKQDIHPLRVFAVEKNLWLYRACLVNLRMLAPFEPTFVLWGDALLLDLTPSSPNWLVANRWHPVDWRQLTPTTADTDLRGFSLACGGPVPDVREYASRAEGDVLACPDA